MRCRISFRVTIFWVVLAQFSAFAAMAEEELLELPGQIEVKSPKKAQAPELELLSPDELNQLYRNEPVATPTPPPATTIAPKASPAETPPPDAVETDAPPAAPDGSPVVENTAAPSASAETMKAPATLIPNAEEQPLPAPEESETSAAEIPEGGSTDSSSSAETKAASPSSEIEAQDDIENADPITVEASAGESVTDEAEASAGNAPETETETEAETEAEAKEIEFDIEKQYGMTSFMLSEPEIRTLNAAFKKYLEFMRGDQTEEEVQTGEVEQEVDKPQPIYPFITMDSIIYHGEDHWAAWINGTKYTPEKMEALPGIVLLSITENEVEIQWKRYQPNTKKAKVAEEIVNGESVEITSEGGKDVISEKKRELPDEVIKMNENTYLISLAPNQAFIPEDFSIHEGRVATARIRQVYENFLRMKAEQARLEAERKAKQLQAVKNGDFNAQEDLAELKALYESNLGEKESSNQR